MTTAPVSYSYFGHLRRTVTLAWPIVAAQALGMSSIFVDTIMVGHAGRAELAALGAGRSLFIMVLVTGLGLLNGILVYAARYDGAGTPEDCGRVWRAGLVYAMATGTVGMVLLALGGGELLTLIGVAEGVREGGTRYLEMVAPAALAGYIATSCSLFLQGVSHPKPAMLIQSLTIPTNFVLNWIFIYGNLGAPAMGAAGAALATSMTISLSAVCLVLFISRSKALAKFRPWGSFAGMWRYGRMIRRFGVPVGAAGALEFTGMTALIMFAGRIGALAISSLEVAFNLHLLAFVVTIGVASATAVRVSNAVGRRETGDVAMVVVSGISLGFISMSPFLVGYVLVPEPFARIFIADPSVVALASSLLLIIAIALPFNSMQMIVLQSLRALGDQWMASALQVLAFFFISVTAGWVLAFTFGLGVRGLVIAMLIGAMSAAVMLISRFLIVRRQLIAAF